MAGDAIVDDTLAAKFATEKDSPYTRWVEGEGLEIIAAHYVPDLNTVELKPWDRRGGRGVFINHEATRTSNDCYVCSIPPGKKLAPQRQLYEEMILILDGRGSTSVWKFGGATYTCPCSSGILSSTSNTRSDDRSCSSERSRWSESLWRCCTMVTAI